MPRSLTDLYLMKSGRNGLVPKKVTVTRGGKSFVTTVYVKGNSEDNTKKNQGKPLEYKNSIEYERAENDFRGIQEECRRLPDEQVRGFHSGSEKLDEGKRGVLFGVLRRWVACKCGSDSDSLRILTHKEKGCTFEIYPNVDGNLVSVFSMPKGFLSTCGKYIVEQGAVKLDCYSSNLQDLPFIYKKTLGFELASRLKFDRTFLEENKGKEYADWFVKTYGEADVLFMAKSDSDNLQQRAFTDYDEAVKYREGFLSDGVKKSLWPCRKE